MPIWGVDTDLNQDTDLSLSYFFFQNLCQEKQRFLTERTIQQYLGLIRNNFNMLDSEKHKGSPKDRKLFYQVIRVGVMLFNATFNNISVISWRSVLKGLQGLKIALTRRPRLPYLTAGLPNLVTRKA